MVIVILVNTVHCCHITCIPSFYNILHIFILIANGLQVDLGGLTIGADEFTLVLFIYVYVDVCVYIDEI